MNLAATMSLDNSRFIGGLKRSMGPLAALTAGVVSLTAVNAGLSKGISLAADAETLQTSFGVLLRDVEKGKEVFNQLTALSDETPMMDVDVQGAGKKLLAFGISADQLVPKIKAIGDIASGIDAPIQEIAEIFGKARTQGTLFAEDINQLTGRGIPVIGEFANILGVSEGAVKGLASQGKITFGVLDQAFKNLTGSGGQFANMMAKQSQTWNGMMSTLKGKVNAVFREFGGPIMDSLKPVLADAIQLAEDLAPKAGKAAEALVKTLRPLTGLMADLFDAEMRDQSLQNLGAGLMASMRSAANTLLSAAPLIGSTIADSFLETAKKLNPLHDPEKELNREAITLTMKELGRGPYQTMDATSPFDMDTWVYDPEWLKAVNANLSDLMNQRSAAPTVSGETLGDWMARMKELYPKEEVENFNKAINTAAENLNGLEGGAPAKPAPQQDLLGGRMNIPRDRLSRIGGFVGGSSPAVDYARKQNTLAERTNQRLDKMISLMRESGSELGWA